MIWYKEKNDNDIMVSTRIRIARNLKKYVFPSRMSPEDAKNVSETIKNSIFKSNSALSNDFEYYELAKTNAITKKALTEQHFISPDLADSKYGAVMINKDQTMSIMINEEDHLRMQVILSGFKLKEAWDTANKIDDLIAENAEYAFDEKLGYLTACPTNLGTGLRASVMMHLPALTLTGEINGIISSASSLGIAVRGIYGEGSEALGNLYQISNQITMGYTEEELIKKVENIAAQIEAHEKEARSNLIKQQKTALEDKVWRSYGILKYAREISSKDAKALISNIILGKALNIIDKESNISLTELMIKTEPALIADGKNMEAQERDIKRAELIRSAFTE